MKLYYEKHSLKMTKDVKPYKNKIIYIQYVVCFYYQTPWTLDMIINLT